MEKLYKIHPSDNVAVVIAESVAPGDSALGVNITQAAVRGHKIALQPIAKGRQVVKYGYPIGVAQADIAPGEWVHSHNLATGLAEHGEYAYKPRQHTNPQPQCTEQYMGYARKNGEVGVRNELWIIPTVGCVNSQALRIAERVRAECDLAGVDDVRAYTHNYGCSQLGGDHANTRRALAALARHPNAGGVLVLGLGCENNQIDALKQEMGDYDPERVRFLTAQECDDEVEQGVAECRRLLDAMRHDARQPMPVSTLRVGVKCGGSDGFSGITANPLVGMFTDWLVAQGGSVLMGEVPEMFGAETILMDRASDAGVHAKIVDMVNGFKHFYSSHGLPVYENPSPGNKAGGITTLEEKSLGCVQKSGSATVADVLGYAHKAATRGLNLCTTPGNDLVSSTALALSGCHMVLFTTGRGTPFGTCVPTLKLSTNTPLAERKPRWIDFDAGVLLGSADKQAVLKSLIDKVIATASGQPANNETAHAKEIAIFKTGVTL